MLLDESPVATTVATDETTASAAIEILVGIDDAVIENGGGIDESLVARIERIVRCRTGCRIRDLSVDLTGNQVIISGLASTYYAKQLATHAALDEIPGCSLTNAIEVQ